MLGRPIIDGEFLTSEKNGTRKWKKISPTPINGIIMFTGSTQDIDINYKICNGYYGTPDLTHLFMPDDNPGEYKLIYIMRLT